jgi:hypothetical protein
MMEVNITPEDRQKREAAIKACETKRARKDERERRKWERSEPIIIRRLKHRVENEIRTTLRDMRQDYRKGGATERRYTISVHVRYGWKLWQRRGLRNKDDLMQIFEDAIKKHSGFSYKAQYIQNPHADVYSEILVDYTLHDNTTPP